MYRRKCLVNIRDSAYIKRIPPGRLVNHLHYSDATYFFSAEYKQIRQEVNRCIEQLPVHLNWFRPTTSMFTINEYV
jgi:hypothetical protein